MSIHVCLSKVPINCTWNSVTSLVDHNTVETVNRSMNKILGTKENSIEEIDRVWL
jgi:hypothetical protein